MKQHRLFIAIHLPRPLRDYLAQLGSRLAAGQPKSAVRPVTAERIHLTLRFLGDTPAAQIDALVRAFQPVAAGHSRFLLRLGRSGIFPKRGKPRVVWAGVAGDVDQLVALKAAVDDVLVPFGWEREQRAFAAHLTLARIKDSRKIQQETLLRPINLEPHPFEVDSFALVKSELRPEGPRYEDLAQFTLAAGS